jgi:hypothetical protein
MTGKIFGLGGLRRQGQFMNFKISPFMTKSF